MRFSSRSVFLLILFLTACQPVSASVGTLQPAVTVLYADTPVPAPTESPTPPLTILTPTPTPDPSPVGRAVGEKVGPTPLPDSLGLDPADWETWPVLPVVTQRARQIFQTGQSLGNDPHAFSVLGDCQSEPNVFMALYDTDPVLVAKLPPELRETVAWFAGSFNRPSPTVKGGTTTGALLWPPWHENQYTCTSSESPLQCELRIHKPAFVIIHVGTHYESHNDLYMRKVLDQVIAAGVVPILASKADDDELDHHVNAEYAGLAAEYTVPFWNFWAAVGELPRHGLYTRSDRILQGDIYLTAVAVDIQRMSALLVLDRVRRAVLGK